jgi:glutathione S-transferase
MLELYHAEPVANSMKVLICLKEKQLEFESHYVNLLRFEQHEPWFVKINPNGQVPVLVHDGKIITESTVINEYLDDVFPEIMLRPADPYWRAQMRIWNKFVDEYFCPALSMIGWHVMVRKIAQSLTEEQLEKMLAKIPLEEQRQKWATVAGDSFSEDELAESRRKLRVSIGRAEAILGECEWLAGPEYSLADLNSFSMIAGVERLHPEIMTEENAPATVGWLRRMEERPAVQQASAMPNKVAETLQAVAS